MADLMQFPETWEEFEANYGFVDSEEIYTNGARLIPSFRVEQWLEHINRKHGKWITMSDADGVYWACSECGEDIPRVAHYNPQFDLFPRLESIDKTNYCPNCGAKMDLE